jgi:hypothetical protein
MHIHKYYVIIYIRIHIILVILIDTLSSGLGHTHCLKWHSCIISTTPGRPAGEGKGVAVETVRVVGVGDVSSHGPIMERDG